MLYGMLGKDTVRFVPCKVKVEKRYLGYKLGKQQGYRAPEALGDGLGVEGQCARVKASDSEYLTA